MVHTRSDPHTTWRHARTLRASKPAAITETADSVLLSPELAAGIRRVKEVRGIGVRNGNWLTEKFRDAVNDRMGIAPKGF